MACKSEHKIMMTQILRTLVGVTSAGSRSSNERQTQSVVVGLVRSIFAVSQHGHAVTSCLIGEIDPLVRGDFKLAFILVRPLDRSDIPVVGGQLVGCAQWECSFQICLFGVPVD